MRATSLFSLVLVLFLATACTRPQSAASACPAPSIGATVTIAAGQVERQALFEPEEAVGGNGEVSSFSIDVYEVTNAQYAAFVAATNYVTVAERTDESGEVLGAAVFDRSTGSWRIDQGANWRHPYGPRSSIEGRDNFPVVTVAYEDAEAYARWAGRRLPSELEWERAARGDAVAPSDVSAEAYDDAGRPVANTWQGAFPIQDTGDDGFTELAPVGCFPPNAHGLYDMVGNVWEWTSDRYTGAIGEPRRYNADAPRVLKGGSNLCARNFCSRFRSGSRQPGDPGLGMSHIGFRTAADAP